MRVVAVTKTFSVEYVRAAFDAGLSVVGENYASELVAKRDATRDLALTWHFLGALQTNKIARVARRGRRGVRGVARTRARPAGRGPRRARASTSRSTSPTSPHATGAAPDDVGALVAHGRDLGLDVAGIMTVAPRDPARARDAFLAPRRHWPTASACASGPWA